MMGNDSPVSKVSLRLMKMQRTNLDKPGKHSRNEVLRVAWNPNLVFNEMWFFDH